MSTPDRIEDRAERGPRSYAVHTRLTMAGTLGPVTAPVEAFSMNLSLGKSDAPTQAQADESWNRCSTWFSNAAAQISPQAQLRSVKLSLIGTDGKVVGNPTVHVGVTPGGLTDRIYPPQVTLAVSLGTGLRGATHRGRVYLPMNLFQLNPDFTIFTADHDAIEGQFVTFLRSLNVQFPGAAGLVIASSKGFNTPVTTVRLGRVADTMRSRRRSLKEAYDVGVTL